MATPESHWKAEDHARRLIFVVLAVCLVVIVATGGIAACLGHWADTKEFLWLALPAVERLLWLAVYYSGKRERK